MKTFSRVQSGSISLLPRLAVLAAGVGTLGWTNALYSQSSDPFVLRQIYNKMNAEAAAATWGTPEQQAQQAAQQAAIQAKQVADATATVPPSANGPSSGFATLTSGGNAQSPAADPGAPSTANAGLADPTSQSSSQDNPAAPQSPSSSPASPAATTPAAEPKPTTKARAAKVTYASGQLTVQADDSSLNQILRQVAKLTGMTITGGVDDTRIFGNYGPAKLSAVLTDLLEGSGSNMVLREGQHAKITELMLTSRHGGATPPSPSAAIYDSDEDAMKTK